MLGSENSPDAVQARLEASPCLTSAIAKIPPTDRIGISGDIYQSTLFIRRGCHLIVCYKLHARASHAGSGQ